MDKKVKQKYAGRWDEYVQKTKQVKETATGSLDAPESARHKRETRIDLYPESWTFFKRDSVISGIELDS